MWNLFCYQFVQRTNIQHQIEILRAGKHTVCVLSTDIINDPNLGDLVNPKTIVLWLDVVDAGTWDWHLVHLVKLFLPCDMSLQTKTKEDYLPCVQLKKHVGFHVCHVSKVGKLMLLIGCIAHVYF